MAEVAEPPGTPGRSQTPSLPDIGGAATGQSPTPTRSRNFIDKLQEEYPHLKKLKVPSYAATDWRKEEARLFFESGGTIKPIKRPKGAPGSKAERDAAQGHLRLQHERLHRKEAEVRQLQAELKLGDLKAIPRDQLQACALKLKAMRERLAGVADGGVGASMRLPPKITKMMTDLDDSALFIERAIGVAEDLAEVAEPPADGRVDAQVQALN
jgi:hypothetical protein